MNLRQRLPQFQTNGSGNYSTFLELLEFALNCQPGYSLTGTFWQLDQPYETEVLLNRVIQERGLEAEVTFDPDLESILCYEVEEDLDESEIEEVTWEHLPNGGWLSRETTLQFQANQICFNCCRPAHGPECEHCGAELVTEGHRK